MVHIEKDENKLEFTTYPALLTIFLLLFPLFTCYALINGNNIGLFNTLVGIFLPIIFISLMEYKKVTFDTISGFVTINTITPFKRSKIKILLSNISNIGQSFGKGRTAHSGILTLITNEGDVIKITSMGSLTASKKDLLELYIKELID